MRVWLSRACWLGWPRKYSERRFSVIHRSILLTLAWDVGGVRIQLLQILILCVSIVLMALLALTLQRSSVGRAIRTVAFSEDVAKIVGVPVNRTILATFFWRALSPARPACLLGMLFNVVSPFMGEHMLVKGLTVIILGGLGNVPAPWPVASCLD